MSLLEIRKLCGADDRMELSRVYEESWKYAYKGIIPDSYLNSIPKGRWASHADKEGMNTLVAAESGRIVGTSSFCKSRFADMEGFGEIVSIYFLPEYMGKGYGKLLLQASVDGLRELGFKDIFLWVLEGNSRARAFYQRHGFQCTDVYLEDNIGGKPLRELRYIRGLVDYMEKVIISPRFIGPTDWNLWRQKYDWT